MCSNTGGFILESHANTVDGDDEYDANARILIPSMTACSTAYAANVANEATVAMTGEPMAVPAP